MSTTAIDINDTRGLHVATLVRDALRNMGRHIAGADVLVCGASYRQDVGDTRYSGSEIVVRKLTEMGAEIRVHDPYVDHWYEFESQDTYPAARPLAGAVLPQPGAADRTCASQKDLAAAMQGVEAVILAVPHEPYLDLARPTTSSRGRAAGRGHRLLRHPRRRGHPALLRARLRGEGARTRPHPADPVGGPGTSRGWRDRCCSGRGSTVGAGLSIAGDDRSVSDEAIPGALEAQIGRNQARLRLLRAVRLGVIPGKGARKRVRPLRAACQLGNLPG